MNGTNKLQIDLSKQPKGVFVVQLKGEKETVSKRVVVY